MSLIDNTYFIRDLNVPLSSNNALNSQFTASISRYENEILQKLLGYQLWKQFTDAVEAATEQNPLSQKWDSLLNGAEFTLEWNGQTITTKWNGLVNDDKVSLIAYYVYYMHRKNNVSQYSGTAETTAKNENSVVVNPLNKMVFVYNQMIDLYGNTPYYARNILSLFDSGSYEHYNAEPSAYNFLLANIADYPDWRFTPLKKINALGI